MQIKAITLQNNRASVTFTNGMTISNILIKDGAIIFPGYGLTSFRASGSFTKSLCVSLRR